MTAVSPAVLMDGDAVRRAVDRMADEVLQSVAASDLVLMGIQRRGVHLSDRIGRALAASGHGPVATGTLDITFYRDDLMKIGPRPEVRETRVPPAGVDDRTVVLVDDVLYTGRTVCAAMKELTDMGRPSRILLCVLVDRGGRELPVQADVVGCSCQVPPAQRIDVLMPEVDGDLAVALSARNPE